MNEHILRIGIIGLDSSHCVAFTEMLNDSAHPYHVSGGRVVAGYRGGSHDLELSYGRIDGFTRTLTEEYGVALVDSPEALAERSDAILLTSVDGRVHLEQFARIAPYGKPVFVDKPFAMREEEARAMTELAARHGVTLLSASSLRYAESLMEACAEEAGGTVYGIDCYGPMKLELLMPGMFWYGVHLAEIAYSVLGPGCESVSTTVDGDQHVVVGRWKGGRVATLRGNRKGNFEYGCLLHGERGSQLIEISKAVKPYYASLLEAIMKMFQDGVEPIDSQEMIEVVRFMEAANESEVSGMTVWLNR
ncbi:Gfo/Idh/MocA family protein [Cohnella soli]|uniref:Gfo/Idh/MocA family protein n=1 Tax=Cohnella soli TaxID=425005 RepID=A0ABW0HND6_9BACL